MIEEQIETILADAGFTVEVVDRPHSSVGTYQAVATGNGLEIEGWGDTREDALKAVLVAAQAH